MKRALCFGMLVALAVALAPSASAQFGASALTPPVITKAERQAEIVTKMARLTDWMKGAGYYGVLINQYRNFQWITAGADMQIVTAMETGPVVLAITVDGGRYYLCSNSEAARMQNEELGELGYQGVVWEWFEAQGEGTALRDAVNQVAQGRKVAADFKTPLADDCSAAIKELRYELTEPEMKKLRWLGRQCAEACEAVCQAIEPGMTEIEIQAMTSDELMRRQIQPTVLLIASDERIFSYRHAIATPKPVEKYCQVNICAKKWGLVIAVTRYVYFGELPREIGHKLRGCAQVCGAYLAATKPGAVAGDVIAAGQRAYARAGFPEEWHKHHQGGAIGYEERDWVGYPGATMLIHPNQAFAWNPTITGAKIEDTILLRADGTFENVTETPTWPSIPVRVGDQIYNAPSILIR